jgi:hypothetical protein
MVYMGIYGIPLDLTDIQLHHIQSLTTLTTQAAASCIL